MSTMLPYVLITPAWNESQFITLTLESVIAQTVRPVRWVIVDDGSTDGTDAIVKKYAAHHEWIQLLTLPPRAERHFAGKAAAFAAGYATVKDLHFAAVANLDADVSFESDYLEFLVAKFVEHPGLGVTGTPYSEDNPIHDDRFKSPDHVSGACQFFRRECYEAIGGYPQVKTGGIDLIALLSAQAKGWQTRRFDEKVCSHHRSVGGGQHANVWRRLFNHGRKDYLLGSHPLFEVFRSVKQMKSQPYVAGGVLMLTGYAWTALRRAERSMPDELVRIRRADQMNRLWRVIRNPRKGLAPRAAAAR